MDPQLFKQLFPNASRSTIEANAGRPELPGQRPAHEEAATTPVRDQLEQRPATRAPRKAGTKGKNSVRFLVRITSVRSCLLDEDNLCEKYVVDCCRYAGLLPGDGPGETKIQVAQRKVTEGEEEHTIVDIYEFVGVEFQPDLFLGI